MCENGGNDIELKSPIDARVIAINETEHYHLPPEHAPYIRAIRGVYLYDANQRVHLCELTPSHYLIFLYNSVLLTDEGLELDDEKRGELYDEYEYGCHGDDIHVHCSDVERLAKATGDYLEDGATEVSYDKCDYEEQIEGLVEHFSCNPPF